MLEHVSTLALIAFLLGISFGADPDGLAVTGGVPSSPGGGTEHPMPASVGDNVRLFTDTDLRENMDGANGASFEAAMEVMQALNSGDVLASEPVQEGTAEETSLNIASESTSDEEEEKQVLNSGDVSASEPVQTGTAGKLALNIASESTSDEEETKHVLNSGDVPPSEPVQAGTAEETALNIASESTSDEEEEKHEALSTDVLASEPVKAGTAEEVALNIASERTSDEEENKQVLNSGDMSASEPVQTGTAEKLALNIASESTSDEEETKQVLNSGDVPPSEPVQAGTAEETALNIASESTSDDEEEKQEALSTDVLVSEPVKAGTAEEATLNVNIASDGGSNEVDKKAHIASGSESGKTVGGQDETPKPDQTRSGAVDAESSFCKRGSDFAKRHRTAAAGILIVALLSKQGLVGTVKKAIHRSAHPAKVDNKPAKKSREVSTLAKFAIGGASTAAVAGAGAIAFLLSRSAEKTQQTNLLPKRELVVPESKPDSTSSKNAAGIIIAVVALSIAVGAFVASYRSGTIAKPIAGPPPAIVVGDPTDDADIAVDTLIAPDAHVPPSDAPAGIVGALTTDAPEVVVEVAGDDADAPDRDPFGGAQLPVVDPMDDVEGPADVPRGDVEAPAAPGAAADAPATTSYDVTEDPASTPDAVADVPAGKIDVGDDTPASV
ncbi:Uncharacterized protein PBTT_05567 [Plasmodiophora brassicae]